MSHEWTAEEAGRRLDVFLVDRVEHMTRAKARALIENGEVRINGRRAKKGVMLAAGDVVTIEALPAPTDFEPKPNAELPLTVLYEDASIVIVDKPAGVPTHPLRPEEDATIVSALVARYPEMLGVGYRKREPGILHRLDTDTSGTLLCARDAATFEALRIALREGRIQKTYAALVEGAVSAPRELHGALAPDPRDARKVRLLDDPNTLEPGARPAWTKLESAERMGAFSLVQVLAPRAGRHQVRAHLAHEGAPLAGDLLYGGPAVPGLTRHFLHAATLEFDHPMTGKRVRAESKLPAELEAVVASLR